MDSQRTSPTRRIAAQVKLPADYTVDWGGLFENMVQAERRLYIFLPLALALILSLLHLTFRSVREALLILI